MAELCLESALALRKRLARREISASEVLRATFERIERINPRLNAIVAIDVEAAEEAAKASDARLAKGEGGLLEGLPITIKDSFEVAGMVTAVGAPNLKDYRPPSDASAVARLRRAGAIILGKTNVPIFTGDFQSYNAVYGTTNNPWDLTRSPGGSSGGAAAAIATGMSALELGSDLGGSIRWPAHCCGIYGLKPTWNLVSTYGHVPPPPQKRLLCNPDLIVAGPLSRSAADLGLALDVIAGPRNPAIRPGPLAESRHISPKGLRVALWLDEPFAPVDASIDAAIRNAANQLEKDGAIIDSKGRPAFAFAEAWEVFALLNHAVVGYGLPSKIRDKIAAQASKYRRGDLSHRALQARGISLSPGAYHEIDAKRQHLRRKWARFFEHYDVVLCPPAPVAAIPHDHSPDMLARHLTVNNEAKPYFDLMFWASLASAADLPAVVAPVALGPDHLPRGIQIIAAAYQDRTAIAVAAMLEALNNGFKAPP
jgi:amidase